jgi:hypothetical protein
MFHALRCSWLLLACFAIWFAACERTGGKGSGSASTPAADTGSDPDVAAKQPAADPDNLDFNPDLPKNKSGPDLKRPDLFIDPGFATPDIKKPKVGFDLPKLNSPPPPDTTTVETTVPALEKPGEGMAKPALKPRILALTLVGGPGNQWIQRVGWDQQGQIFAESGGGGFTVNYSGNGVRFLGVKGDVKVESVGPRGQLGGRPFIATCPTTNVQLEIGTSSGLVLPYLRSSAGWQWWERGQADLKGLEAKSRGHRFWFLHDGKFLAKASADAGNTILARNPRDISKENALAVNVPEGKAAGPFTYYTVGNIKTGAPQAGTFIRERVLAEAIDPWERLYLGSADKDEFKKGGLDGFTVLDADLTTVLFNSTIGADAIYSMAIRDDMLLLGGMIGRRPENAEDAIKNKAGLEPAMLRMINPAQADPGGGEDGIFAIIKLW